MPRSQSITREEMRDALSRSGYLLETRVDTLLKRRGFFAEPNTAYEDPETGKSRELDVHAISAMNCGRDRFDFLFRILIIECVNNPQPLVFFTKPPVAPVLHRDAIALSGLPLKVWPEKGKWTQSVDLHRYLKMEEWHHYCRGRTASQYCSFTRKGGGQSSDWMALHEGSHFDTIKKLCDATHYFQEEHAHSWVWGVHEPVNLQIYYPILVVQGELLELRSGRPAGAVSSVGHVQYRQAVSARGSQRYHQIDVVQERVLPKLLRQLDKERDEMCRLLTRRRSVVAMAVERIAARARRARSAESVQKIMEP